jgi:hypothetical protein
MAKAQVNISALANQLSDDRNMHGGSMSESAWHSWIKQTKAILGKEKIVDAISNGRGGFDLFASDHDCGCEWIFRDARPGTFRFIA